MSSEKTNSSKINMNSFFKQFNSKPESDLNRLRAKLALVLSQIESTITRVSADRKFLADQKIVDTKFEYDPKKLWQKSRIAGTVRNLWTSFLAVNAENKLKKTLQNPQNTSLKAFRSDILEQELKNSELVLKSANYELFVRFTDYFEALIKLRKLKESEKSSDKSKIEALVLIHESNIKNLIQKLVFNSNGEIQPNCDLTKDEAAKLMKKLDAVLYSFEGEDEIELNEANLALNDLEYLKNFAGRNQKIRQTFSNFILSGIVNILLLSFTRVVPFGALGASVLSGLTLGSTNTDLENIRQGQKLNFDLGYFERYNQAKMKYQEAFDRIGFDNLDVQTYYFNSICILQQRSYDTLFAINKFLHNNQNQNSEVAILKYEAGEIIKFLHDNQLLGSNFELNYENPLDSMPETLDYLRQMLNYENIPDFEFPVETSSKKAQLLYNSLYKELESTPEIEINKTGKQTRKIGEWFGRFSRYSLNTSAAFAVKGLVMAMLSPALQGVQHNIPIDYNRHFITDSNGKAVEVTLHDSSLDLSKTDINFANQNNKTTVILDKKTGRAIPDAKLADVWHEQQVAGYVKTEISEKMEEALGGKDKMLIPEISGVIAKPVTEMSVNLAKLKKMKPVSVSKLKFETDFESLWHTKTVQNRPTEFNFDNTLGKGIKVAVGLLASEVAITMMLANKGRNRVILSQKPEPKNSRNIDVLPQAFFEE